MKRPKRQGPCKVETTLQNPSPVAPRLHHDTTGVSHSTYTKDETTDERRLGIHATRLGRVWYTLKSEHRRNFTVAKRLPRLNAEERGHHQKTTMVKPALDPVADTESKEGRIKFEEENYYICGINGCILRDHHQGACIFPDVGSRRRMTRAEYSRLSKRLLQEQRERTRSHGQSFREKERQRIRERLAFLEAKNGKPGAKEQPGKGASHVVSLANLSSVDRAAVRKLLESPVLPFDC